MDAALVFVVVAAVVLLAALVVYILPSLRPAGTDAISSTAGPAPARSASPGAPLVHGFTYLQVRTSPGARRGSVQTRLERACRRIDAVDPHLTSRRIGEALLPPAAAPPAPGAVTGRPVSDSPFGSPAPPTPPGQPAVLWVDPPQDRREEQR